MKKAPTPSKELLQLRADNAYLRGFIPEAVRINEEMKAEILRLRAWQSSVFDLHPNINLDLEIAYGKNHSEPAVPTGNVWPDDPYA
jgi:hypothetical protein